ncbi:hypothetical protein BKA66DRAFT_509823 [Pyrenochaeta sp. MPI-SDFR-AT-0127]|nr:hypothetical protein BKA66DRAFT_509823 [Pyrenochaeta sp. MPI-SDFR-AT-0127]
MARVHNTATDYSNPTTCSNKLHRPLLLANHVLHLFSSIIAMSIAAYFIHNFRRNTHLVYWISVAAIDTILHLPALILPIITSYKGYLTPLSWIFSYLWLTAFNFAAQDYSSGRCVYNSSAFVNKCSSKNTLAAFAFIAFFTNLIGTLFEGKLWDVQRFKRANDPRNLVADRHHAGTQPITTLQPMTPDYAYGQ